VGRVEIGSKYLIVSLYVPYSVQIKVLLQACCCVLFVWMLWSLSLAVLGVIKK
jgi:hypothetical protein